MLVLSEKQVQSLIDIDELIAALEQAHIQYSTGKAVMPVRLVVPLPQIQGRITSMPGYLNEDKALGMKVVTYFQDNPKQNLPAILATIMLFSSDTGKMIAAMDGGYITAIRTACASALATRVLANPEHAGAGNLGRRRAGARPYSSPHPGAEVEPNQALQSVGKERTQY